MLVRSLTLEQKTCATGSLPPECHLDPKCICSKASFISDISCCVAKNCPASAVQKSLQVAQQLCSTVKVTLPNPQPDSCAGGALAGGSSSAPASSSSAPASSGVNTAASSTGCEHIIIGARQYLLKFVNYSSSLHKFGSHFYRRSCSFASGHHQCRCKLCQGGS